MRHLNRAENRLRPVEIVPNYNPYAEGSCLIKCGNTHVLCTATVEEKVPAWLKGQGRGWVTAEYALLPRSTKTRVPRETHGVSGRTHEIQRLIGRSLRAVTDLSAMPDISILIDCDVLQADGGTRTASITGAFVALSLALRKLAAEGKIESFPIKENLAAVSCGLNDGKLLLDLDYEEDSTACADANFVLTESGKIVEVQVTAEQEPFTRTQFDELAALAAGGIAELIRHQKIALGDCHEN